MSSFVQNVWRKETLLHKKWVILLHRMSGGRHSGVGVARSMEENVEF
jgi:hypothetical protein